MKAAIQEPKAAEQKSDTKAKPDPNTDAKNELKSLPMAEVQKKLDSTPDGLTEAEAKKRLAADGPNEIAEEKDNPFLKFLTYFWGPIPWMIEAAVILSGVVRHWPDFFIILVLLLSNAVVGFWEEHQAGNAIAALKKKLASTAKVKRDGKWTDPPAREVVKGDVIRLRLRDIVPADARLLEGDPSKSISPRSQANRCLSIASRAMPYFLDRSCGRARSRQWCMPPERIPISARPHNLWNRRHGQSFSEAP